MSLPIVMLSLLLLDKPDIIFIKLALIVDNDRLNDLTLVIEESLSFGGQIVADGDIVHSSLSWPYQKPYKALCGEKYDHNERVWFAMEALLKDIKKKYGVLAVKLANSMGESLSQIIKNVGENNFVDWRAASMKLQQLAQQAKVPHYVEQLVLRAGKSILHEFRYHLRVDTNNLPEVVMERFFKEVYKSKFEERIPLTPAPYANVDHATVAERVEAIRPDIMAQISKWAKKATVDEDVKNLRRSPRKEVKEIDLEEDLL